MTRPTIRVLVVASSRMTRGVLTAILTADREIGVAAAVPSMSEACAALKRVRADVIVVDVSSLPGGVWARLEEVAMRAPVVVVSPPAPAAEEKAAQALALGAVEVVRMSDGGRDVVETVKAAARAHSRPSGAAARRDRTRPGRSAAGAASAECLIAVGASAGGTEAIRQVLTTMPPDGPGLVIVQHMPAGFTKLFAKRCDDSCRVRVTEAKDGDWILSGHTLIAPGDRHMRVHRDGRSYRVTVEDGPPVNGHRPSIDALFTSIASAAGPNAVGVILTGMGTDGARGLFAMKRAGARTLAQDEASCVVFGMPREAIALGAVDFVLPLSEIGRAALELSGAPATRSR